MAVICRVNNEIIQNTRSGKENQQDVKIDLECELLCALKEIKRLKGELTKYEDLLTNASQQVANLETQLAKSKRIE